MNVPDPQEAVDRSQGFLRKMHFQIPWRGSGTSVLQGTISFTLIHSETLFYTALLCSTTTLPMVALSCVIWVSSLSALLNLDLRHSDK